jgi:hypothetical protein
MAAYGADLPLFGRSTNAEDAPHLPLAIPFEIGSVGWKTAIRPAYRRRLC